MKFSPDFFKPEYRDGFYVSEMMKRNWSVLLIMVEELGKLCNKLGIRYQIVSGTLLGAVRHKGFIPWDDDIDLLMLREDYTKLLEHADELPDPYWILSIYNSDTFYNFHGVLKNNKNMDRISNGYRKDLFNGYPFIAGIDIYPHDNIFDDVNKREIQRLFYTWGYSLLYKYIAMEEAQKSGHPCTEEEGDAFLDELSDFGGQVYEVTQGAVELDVERPIINAICLATDKVARLAENKDCEMVCSFPYVPRARRIIALPRVRYEESTMYQFEEFELPGPKQNKEVLTLNYGPNYMTPVKSSANHNYPYYRTQASYIGYEIEMAEFEFRHKSDASIDLEIKGKYNKIVLNYISIESIMTEGVKILKRANEIIETAKRDRDTLVWWFIVDGSWSEIINDAMPQLISEYRELIEQAEKANPDNLVLDKSGDYERAVESCNEYLGDEGIIAVLCRKKDREVKLYNYMEL